MTDKDNNSTDSVKIVQKEDEHFVHIEDGATEVPQNQPKRRYGETLIQGIIVGRGENQAVIRLDDVKKLAALHLTYKDMADYFGVKENTFRDHFKTEIDRARLGSKQRLIESMLYNATNKLNPTIQIWLSKQWLGMSDQQINNDEDKVLPWLDQVD
mgnify:CR=1 FL=1|tara:strand:+ start:983 stop:1450 length:468 start_codon:yes stop_codon:yes gene_type:complete